MDGSGEVYSGFPNNDHGHTNDPKRCSVRGCTQLLTDGANNKMCDVCRSRHRIYASTKRARRKLEKAAVANAVAARNGGDTFTLIHESDHSISQGSSAVSPWLSPSVQSHQQVCIYLDFPFGSAWLSIFACCVAPDASRSNFTEWHVVWVHICAIFFNIQLLSSSF
jgi:hypothetical protein